MAFVIAAYARRILGWRAATSMTADLVLDAVEQAIWVREHEGRADFTALVAHHDHGSQYLSLAHTQRLAEAGIRPSVGAVGSCLLTGYCVAFGAVRGVARAGRVLDSGARGAYWLGHGTQWRLAQEQCLGMAAGGG